MRLSAPIYRLKRQAKLLSREVGIPLNKALDRVAKDEGFQSWSMLATHLSASSPAAKMLARLHPEDLVLLGARPGHGKTLMGLELIVEAVKTGRKGVFYTLECNEAEILKRLHQMGADLKSLGGALTVDTSEAISADYIIDQMRTASRGTLVVIDYLQLLDQKREKPVLAKQVFALKSFARKTGLIIVFISQIDRSYNPSTKALPDMGDVRLPNPLDLTLFSKTCFLSDGEVRLTAVG